jgi:hypothetical protein
VEDGEGKRGRRYSDGPDHLHGSICILLVSRLYTGQYVLSYCADNGRTASTTKQDLLHKHFLLHMGIYRLLLRSLSAYYAFIISSANPKV